MPVVGKRKYDYTDEGVGMAEEEALKTGLPIEYEDRHRLKYVHGGSVVRGISGNKEAVRGGGSATRGLGYNPPIHKADLSTGNRKKKG